MRDYLQKVSARAAGYEAKAVWRELGIGKEYYLDKLALYFNVSINSVKSWDRLERGLPASVTYEELTKAIDEVVTGYLKDGAIPQKKRNDVTKAWSNKREDIFKRLQQYCNGEGLTPYVSDRINDIEAEFEKLSQPAAFTLYSCFEALDSVTIDDCSFIQSLLELSDAQKVELEEELGRCKIPARFLLECFRSQEMPQWMDILNAHSSKKNKAELWELVRDKLVTYGSDFYIWGCIFEILLDGREGEPLFIPGFGEAERDLFIMYKYCLPEDAQRKIRAGLRDRKHKEAHRDV